MGTNNFNKQPMNYINNYGNNKINNNFNYQQMNMYNVNRGNMNINVPNDQMINSNNPINSKSVFNSSLSEKVIMFFHLIVLKFFILIII